MTTDLAVSSTEGGLLSEMAFSVIRGVSDVFESIFHYASFILGVGEKAFQLIGEWAGAPPSNTSGTPELCSSTSLILNLPGDLNLEDLELRFSRSRSRNWWEKILFHEEPAIFILLLSLLVALCIYILLQLYLDNYQGHFNLGDILKDKLSSLRATWSGLFRSGDRLLCVVCRDGQLSQMAIPCNHLCLCWTCKGRLVQEGDWTCPICRSPANYVQAYLP